MYYEPRKFQLNLNHPSKIHGVCVGCGQLVYYHLTDANTGDLWRALCHVCHQFSWYEQRDREFILQTNDFTYIIHDRGSNLDLGHGTYTSADKIPLSEFHKRMKL